MGGKLMIAAAGVVVGLALAAGFRQPAQGRPPEAAARWEYTVVLVSDRETDKCAALLNLLAGQGWEYAGLVRLERLGESYGGYVALRRPKK